MIMVYIVRHKSCRMHDIRIKKLKMTEAFFGSITCNAIIISRFLAINNIIDFTYVETIRRYLSILQIGAQYNDSCINTIPTKYFHSVNLRCALTDSLIIG